ncbi:MAG: hypothetical protein OXP07_20455 [Defluviicoccus sp.]|nr:hypothetical protein [Defluviicoccus sp.]
MVSEAHRRLGLAAAALALAMTAGQAGADAVGFRDIQFEAGGETLVAALWYPTGAAPGRTALGPISMDAARDAPPGAGRHGLVLISHGTGGGRLNHRGTAIRLARAGYVALAPEHAGDSWRDGRYSGTSANWHRRPRQLGAALDRVLDDPELGPRIDRLRIGALGHSAGGYSVLALAGARADLSALARHCTRLRDRDPEFCAYGRRDGAAGGALPDLSDRRVRAVAAVAPVGALFGAGAFARVAVPVEIHRLGKDRVLRFPFHADHIARLIGRGVRPAVHPGAHHFAFISPFPAALAAEIGRPARDPPGFDRRAFLARIDRRIVAFFDRALPATRK